MTQQDKDRIQSEKKVNAPQTDEMAKQKERQKAEEQEVAGRHKNDGQKSHKGRR
jgi:hypothetical protein